MASLNRVLLIGYVGRDPETKEGATTVAKFTLATNERGKDDQDVTEWHSIVAFGKTADVVAQYVVKGRQVYVEGRIKTGSWEDRRTGETRKRTEIIADRVLLLGPKQVPQERETRGLAQEQLQAEAEDDSEPPF